ncbi:hypothetical protein AMAG_07732 [Allomyces macrogynus ATCC 38327]|uniref:tRNA/rRNA methyltransferase SpoU type domain-containing protein n=1 Tax=Allomyces macrogynus (strain ATCC 38327) TaxID=578462 RepID=A0A0L0SJH6_ALLM3|nr:hypothetical protein AMAG_07732 [Allomyces macrogynus ATCC 38327]|eukprot:KNE62520.1 hypothetical protein AMAG_07732 [Allomyces macrogynus ATCC 38327]
MVQALGRIGSPANVVATAEVVFAVVTPWLATNHFTVRLHTQWVISRTWRICETHEKHDGAPVALKALLARQDLVALVKFIQTNRDSTKFRTKYIAAKYLNNDFDPVDDWTLTFVFELFPTLSSETASDEHISARAFRRVLQGGDVKVDVGAGWPRISAPERVFHLMGSQIEDEAQLSHGADLVVDQATGVVADMATSAPRTKSGQPNGGKGKGKNKGKIKCDTKAPASAQPAEAAIHADQPATGLGAVQNMIRSIPGAVGAGRAGRFQFILLAAGNIIDVCIEIPHLGLTRSLNVHNSAVILIWEYVRRQLLALNA